MFEHSEPFRDPCGIGPHRVRGGPAVAQETQILRGRADRQPISPDNGVGVRLVDETHPLHPRHDRSFPAFYPRRLREVIGTTLLYSPCDTGIAALFTGTTSMFGRLVEAGA